MILFLVGLLIGGILGFVVAMLCVSAARGDELMERAAERKMHE